MASTKSVEQPANGTRSSTDMVTLVQTLDAAGNATGAGAATASTAVTGAGTANVTTASTETVATNSTRRGLTVTNNSDTDVSLALGATAVANRGIVLKANGGVWDGKVSDVLWRGAVNGIHAGTGTKTVGYVEV